MTKHETTAESLRAENERLREQLADMASEDATYRIQRDALAEALRQCRGYFDDRADAEYFTDSPTPLPNEEMRLLVEIDDALATLESPTDALTRQGQEMGEYDGWTTHDSEQMPDGLAPAQLVETNGPILPGQLSAPVQAGNRDWSHVRNYRLPRDPDDLPYCSAEGLKRKSKYVWVSTMGVVLQSTHDPRKSDWAPADAARAPETHRKAGSPKQSLMRVWRGE